MWMTIAIIVHILIAAEHFFVIFTDQISTFGTQRRRNSQGCFAVPANLGRNLQEGRKNGKG